MILMLLFTFACILLTYMSGVILTFLIVSLWELKAGFHKTPRWLKLIECLGALTLVVGILFIAAGTLWMWYTLGVELKSFFAQWRLN